MKFPPQSADSLKWVSWSGIEKYWYLKKSIDTRHYLKLSRWILKYRFFDNKKAYNYWIFLLKSSFVRKQFCHCKRQNFVAVFQKQMPLKKPILYQYCAQGWWKMFFNNEISEELCYSVPYESLDLFINYFGHVTIN